MKEIKDSEKKQNKILLAPVIVYMLAGYGLLFACTELRDQVRVTTGQSRQRVSEFREETVETLRHIVPRGRP